MGDCRYCKHWLSEKRKTDEYAECDIFGDEGTDAKVIVMSRDWERVETEFDFGCHQFETYLPPLSDNPQTNSWRKTQG